MQRHAPSAFALSRTGIQRLVDQGRIRVNGVAARRAAQRLAAGDRIAVDVAMQPPRHAPLAEPLALTILYEDADLVVVVKPAGMVVHPTARQRDGTVVNALLWHAAMRHVSWTPRLVQRLDRGTSGLLVAAKSAAVHTELQRGHRRAVKDYLAVVWGRPVPPRGLLEGKIGRDPLDRRRMMVREAGAPSSTSYARLARTAGEPAGLSLLRCRLGTGRTHQIRVHLAERGWPIVGDATYGAAPRRRLTSTALDRLARAFPRPALHAWQLTFVVPATGRARTFTAPLPDDLTTLIAAGGLTRGLPPPDPQ